MTPTSHDIDIAARTAWGEARGLGDAGMRNVLSVIVNRAKIAAAYGRKHPLFGDGSWAGACLAPWQFSCWNANDPNRARLISVTEDTPAFAGAVLDAHMAADGLHTDRTGGATHYYAKSMPKPPKWATGATQTYEDAGHRFFRVA